MESRVGQSREGGAMAALGQFTYIFVVGTIFAFLDAWNIGTNDVVDLWETPVWSRSVTLIQAKVLSGIMEATGASSAGDRVADTIRTKIVDPKLFQEDPAVLMLGMLCAVIASAVFLTMATRLGFPISTTHSILGGVMGMGIATVGSKHVTWVQKKGGKFEPTGGVVTVFLAWIVAPLLAGVFAAAIFLVTKYGVLVRRNPLKAAIYTVPFYFGVTASLLCMLVVTKGGRIDSNLSENQIAGVVVGTGAGAVLLVAIFLLPWLHRKVVMEDWKIRWYHVFLGPLLLKRDFYAGYLTQEGDKDVVQGQTEKDILGGDLEATHAVAEHYDKVEYVFGFLQVMTAATASFTHGANDVANAIGPYATIFQIWNTGIIPPSKSKIPDWILCFGGGAIIIGLWTYSYLIMRNFRYHLILPLRFSGFSIHLGAAISVIVATKLSLPISTTQCITGATVAVNLCNGTWGRIKWRMVLWIYLGWMITLPVAGLFSGMLMGFVINAPHYKDER